MAIIALVMIPAATTSSRSVHGLPNCAVSRSWMTERSWRTTVGKSRKFTATLPKTNLATVDAKDMPTAWGRYARSGYSIRKMRQLPKLQWLLTSRRALTHALGRIGAPVCTLSLTSNCQIAASILFRSADGRRAARLSQSRRTRPSFLAPHPQPIPSCPAGTESVCRATGMEKPTQHAVIGAKCVGLGIKSARTRRYKRANEGT